MRAKNLPFLIKNRRRNGGSCSIASAMKKPACPGRRFAGALFPVLAIAISPLWAGPVYTIQDGGVTRQFEVADDEVSVFQKGGAAKKVTESLNGAVILSDFGSRAVVRFPQAANWKAAVGPRAVGGAQFEPVMYEQGQPRKESTRRIMTPQVLASGAAEAELVKVSGAASAKAMTVPGYVLLTFPTATDALGGMEKLRAAGFKAEAQLRKKANKRAVPNDEFFSDQWHLRNTGQGNGLVGVDVNPLLAWDFYTGEGVNIAIVDDGLELDHEDLEENAFPLGVGGPHHDWNDDNDNPSPGIGDAHGTACAGVAAARGDNFIGVSGGAPQASLMGLRLISGPVSDLEEQQAFLWNGGTSGIQVDISSNSWGPFDGFVNPSAPGLLARDGLRLATTNGRGGLGTVFVWAGGNGGLIDNVNADGYANSRFVIAVGAVANSGKRSSYSEIGSPLLVCAPSNGGFLGITTTDVSGDGGYNFNGAFGESPDVNYTNSFGGTSSATPLVSGVAALVMEANTALGYRDVMEILTSTATKVDAADAGWATNGSGFLFNHSYGGGMVDATAAVIRAESWVNLAAEVQEERVLAAPAVPVVIPDAVGALERDFNFSTAQNVRVEHIEVQLDIKHANRSDLDILLISPSGHISRLMDKRNRPTSGEPNADFTDGNLGWVFTTTQHWGENSLGTWKVKIADSVSGTQGSLMKARVRIFGTPATDTRFTFDKKIDTIAEAGGQIVVPVSRLNNTTGSATVDYFISTKASATNALDFTSVAGTLTFADGIASQNITIPILDDVLNEGNERFYVVLRNPSTGTLGGITVQTIQINDDEGNAVSVVASDANAAETNSAIQLPNNGVFTISRRFPEPTELVVKFALTQPPGLPIPVGTPNYATHTDDYNTLLFQAKIPASATSVDVMISPKDDRFSEGTELVEMTLVADAAYVIAAPSSAIVSIVDNDLIPVSVTASVASVLENSNTEIVYTIFRDTNQLDSPLNIYLEPSGSAAPQVDYDPPFPAIITIPPGKSTATVSIRPNDNSTPNPMKTIVLGVSQGPEYKEGFFRTVEVRIFDDEPVPDKVKPTLAIAFPINTQRFNSPDAILANGSAIDNPDSADPANLNVAQVRYRLNLGPWNVATLTNTAWDADITALALLGDNRFDAYSIDEDGNESAISSVRFAYVKNRDLTTSIVGPGGITADFFGTRTLEVGQPYTIVAKPIGSTSLFDGWSGEYTATNKVLSFIMPDKDISLTATFSFLLINEAVAGKYAGLVRDNGKAKGIPSFELSTSGFFSANVSRTGRFTGTLIFGGVKYRVAGDVTASGAYIGQIPRKNNTPLDITLQLDVDPAGSKTLNGLVTAGGRASEIRSHKQLTKPEAAFTTQGIVGKYTFQLPMAETGDAAKPQGTGVATLALDISGRIRWSGVLPDGTRVSQTASLSKDKTWPLFLNLYRGRGTMMGTVLHDKLAISTDLSGDVDWAKIGDPRDPFFPNGFNISESRLLGSEYVQPFPGQRVLAPFATSSGNVILEEGNFRAPFPVKSLTITELNKFLITPLQADELALSLISSNGAITGSFIHPVTLKKTKISGVVLQKTGRVVGIFNGTTPTNTALQTGRMLILVPSI